MFHRLPQWSWSPPFVSSSPAAPVSAAVASAPAIVLSDRVGPQTQPLTVSGTGFVPSSPFKVVFGGRVAASGVSAADGSVTLTLPVPASALPGPNEVRVVALNRSAAATFVVRNAWRQEGGDPRHTGSTVENLITPRTVKTLTPIWTTQGGFQTQPLVVDGEVVIGYGNSVRAVSATDGHELWTFDTGGPIFDTPAVADGLVLVGSHTGVFYALDLVTGVPRWQYQAIAPLTVNPAASDGVVVVPVLQNGLFVALRILDGAVLWTKHFTNSYAASPTIADGIVYVADAVFSPPTATHMAALGLHDGHTIWQVKSAHGVYIDHMPISDGVLFARTIQDADPFHSALVAIRARDGSTLWSTTIGSDYLFSPAVHGTRVFVPLDDGMAAYDVATGAQVWKYQSGTRAENATIAGGVVYFGMIDSTAGVATVGVDELTGKLLWRATPGETNSPPSVVDGTVYIDGGGIGTGLVAYRPAALVARGG